MSAHIRRYISEQEDFQFNRGMNETELQASKLRKNFLNKFIIGFDTNLYKTQEERDWAYICKRQYNYDVRLTSLGYSFMIANIVFSWRSFVRKSIVYWPVLIVLPTYLYFERTLLQKHSKKLFDMCNLGQEFYLGQKRNQVLRVCNQMLDVEDF